MFARRQSIKPVPVKPAGFEVGRLRHFFRTTPVCWPSGPERVLTLVGSPDHSCSHGVMRHVLSQALSRQMGVWYFGCRSPGSPHYLMQKDDPKRFRELHFGTGRVHLFNPIYRFSPQEVIRWCELALLHTMEPPEQVYSTDWHAAVVGFWSALVPVLVNGEELGLWERGIKQLHRACCMDQLNAWVADDRFDPALREGLLQWMQGSEHAAAVVERARSALSMANMHGFEDGIADFDAVSVAEENLRVMVSVPYGIGRNPVNLQLTSAVMASMLVAQSKIQGQDVSHMVVIDSPMYVLASAQLLTCIPALGNVACNVLASVEDEMQMFPFAEVSLSDLGPLVCLGRSTKGFLKKGKARKSLSVSSIEDASGGKILPMTQVGSYRADRLAAYLDTATAATSSVSTGTHRL
jgi:hypothetical protein